MSEERGLTQVLGYGRVVRRGWLRVSWRWPLAGVAALLAVAAVLILNYERIYYWDRDGVTAALQVPPPGVVRVWGFDDGPFWKVAEAEVVLDQAGTRHIVFQSPRANGFRRGTEIRLLQLGNYHFIAQRPDGSACEWIDVGRHGRYVGLLPSKPQRAQDVVDWYDEVLASVESHKGFSVHRGADGRQYLLFVGSPEECRAAYREFDRRARTMDANSR